MSRDRGRKCVHPLVMSLIDMAGDTVDVDIGMPTLHVVVSHERTPVRMVVLARYEDDECIAMVRVDMWDNTYPSFNGNVRHRAWNHRDKAHPLPHWQFNRGEEDALAFCISMILGVIINGTWSPLEGTS